MADTTVAIAMTPGLPYPPNPFIPKDTPVKGTVKLLAGQMVAMNASGLAVNPLPTDNTMTVLGVANETADNTAGADSAINVRVRRGQWWMKNSASADLIATANLNQPCFVADNQTVALTSNNGARPQAGSIRGVDAMLGVLVDFGTAAASSPGGGGGAGEADLAYRVVRAIQFANVASLASMSTTLDGLTLVAGDRVLLANQTTTTQNGIYVVASVNGANCALELAADWATGLVFGGLKIGIRAGTIGSVIAEVKVTNVAAIVVGTDTPVFVPTRQKGSVALASGVATVSTGVWITATTKLVLSRGPLSGTPGTFLTQNGAMTTGLPSTGAFSIIAGTAAASPAATSTDAGTIIYELIDG